MSEKLPIDLPQGYIEFYKNLEAWQNKQQIKLRKNNLPPIENVLKILALKNRPVLQCVEVSFDVDQYKLMYRQLLTELQEWRTEVRPQVDKVMDNLEQVDFNLLALKYLAGDRQYFSELSKQLQTSAEFLIFTADHALRPLLRILADPYYAEFASAGFTNWPFIIICPLCGSRSHFSRLRAGDGRRFMFCEHCFTEWESRTLVCVHCGNDNPEKIQYSCVEGNMSYQLYTCEECKGYLKTYDERHSGKKTDLFIANIETVYLDMWAQKQGYSAHDDSWAG